MLPQYDVQTEFEFGADPSEISHLSKVFEEKPESLATRNYVKA